MRYGVTKVPYTQLLFLLYAEYLSFPKISHNLLNNLNEINIIAFRQTIFHYRTCSATKIKKGRDNLFDRSSYDAPIKATHFSPPIPFPSLFPFLFGVYFF
jgi:hypothetical protein